MSDSFLSATAAASRPYRVRYADRLPQPLPERVLACIVRDPVAPDSDDPRVLHLPVERLAGPAVELWESVAPVRSGRDADIDYAENDALLFGQVCLPQCALDAVAGQTRTLYQRIDALIRRRGYPGLLRVWHFLEAITEGEGDQERYRQFSLGRHQAIAQMPDFESCLPAATAIGLSRGGLRVWFMATRQRARQVENPRQVSAFRYPRQYGPRSPSFSRAVLMPWADGADLIVSGTASVVGHETVHAGAPAQQWREIVENLASLQRQGAEEATAWSAEYATVYLRDAALLPALLPAIRDAFGPDVPVTILRADICRDDLDVEAEALYRADTASEPRP
ncbi:MAG: hypothetical protein PHP86_01580 [Nevskiales bacterium]|nr:hypothetical protein [Nevskiales bacterium]